MSNRDTILRRWFKAFVQRGKYTSDEFHLFCVTMKGKHEMEIIRELNE